MALISVLTGVASLVAQSGVSSLIGNVTGTLITKTDNKVMDKVLIGIGGLVVSAMVTDKVGEFVEKKAQALKDAVTPVCTEEVKDVPEDFDDDFFKEEADETEEE